MFETQINLHGLTSRVKQYDRYGLSQILSALKLFCQSRISPTDRYSEPALITMSSGQLLPSTPAFSELKLLQTSYRAYLAGIVLWGNTNKGLRRPPNINGRPSKLYFFQ